MAFGIAILFSFFESNGSYCQIVCKTFPYILTKCIKIFGQKEKVYAHFIDRKCYYNTRNPPQYIIDFVAEQRNKIPSPNESGIRGRSQNKYMYKAKKETVDTPYIDCLFYFASVPWDSVRIPRCLIL